MENTAPSHVPSFGPAEPSHAEVGTSPLRARRLAEIRAAIENGSYETTERLEAALSRFLAEVGGHF